MTFFCSMNVDLYGQSKRRKEFQIIFQGFFDETKK